MLHVFDHVAQYRQIECRVRIGSVIAVELAAFDQGRDPPGADTLDTGFGNLQRIVAFAKSAVGNALQYRPLARSYLQYRRVRMGATQRADIVRLVNGTEGAPFGDVLFVISIVILLQSRIDTDRLNHATNPFTSIVSM